MNTLRRKIDFYLWRNVHLQNAAAIRGWQSRRFTTVAKAAYSHIPLYKQLWDSTGVGCPDDLAHIEQLPIVDKQTFAQRRLDEYVAAQALAAPDTKFAYTAGSTGEPIRFIRTQYAGGDPVWEQRYADVKQLRPLLWDGFSAKALAGIRVLELKAGGPETPTRHFVPMPEVRENPEHSLEQVRAFQPQALVGYSSFVFELAKLFERYGDTPFVPYIIVGGQPLTKEEMALVKQIFKAEVYSRYSFEEFRAVAVECTEHDGFHTYPESFFFETVDESGVPTKKGEVGRIIITDLYNEAMPFIRYATGDYGRLEEGVCRCGISGPRLFLEKPPLASLHFATRALSRGDTNRIIGRYFHAVTQYQICKQTDKHLEVRLVPGNSYSDAIKKEIRESFKQLLGQSVEITIHEAHTLSSKSKHPLLFVDES